MSALTIGIEGSDGVGKATQSKMLKEYFESLSKKVAVVSFPRYTETCGGKILWELMKSERSGYYSFVNLPPRVASLFYAADRLESKSWLEKLILTNDVVIFDRYVESNLIHQGGKLVSVKERHDLLEYVKGLEYGTHNLPKPDKILYLSLPVEISIARAVARAKEMGVKLDSVESDFLYLENSCASGMFYAEHLGWNVINCENKNPDQVHSEIKIMLDV